MNDFTKEELQIICNNTSPCVSPEMRPVLDKIQSMIDNDDCEHQFIINLDENFIPVSPSICMICGVEE